MAPQSAHPIDQLTTAELSGRRRELERAIKVLKDAPVAADLQQQLEAVRAEENSRASIRRAVRGIDTETRLRQHHSA